ncbi:MAG: aldo/keto reductase [Cyclobacteriaceae bacterium]
MASLDNQHKTPAQVSLAWLMAQKPWIVPIPCTTKLAHLQENLWSADAKLSAGDLKQLTDTFSKLRLWETDILLHRHALAQSR